MPRRLALTLLLALSALAAAVPAAHAAWYGAEAIDGPAAEIEKLGNVDLARDGTGAVAYIKRVDGTSRVFISRFLGGTWRPPERVDGGLGGSATDVAVAVADRYRIAVVWTAGDKVFGSVVVGNDEQPGPPLGPTELYSDPAPGGVTDPDIDMGINGTAYATWAAPGGGGSDVRVSRLQDITWSLVGQPLDIDPSQPAGRDAQRARVGVSAEGNALVVWGEGHADGRDRVYGRRVTGMNPSAAPQELSLNDFEGRLGGPADSPDVDIEDDGSFAWAVFRQSFAGGGSRSIARRLLGSQFEAPVALDGGPDTGKPRISINGRGQGEAVVEAGGGVTGSYLFNDLFAPSAPLHSQGSTQGTEPQAAASEHRDMAVAWRLTDGAGSASVRARLKPDEAQFTGETQLSGGQFGTVEPGQFSIAADRLAGFAVAMVQGAEGSPRWLTGAVHDRPPGRPGGQTTGTWQRRARPRFKWAAGVELWGQQRFRVIVGGQVVGETTATSLTPNVTLTTGRPLPWRVIAIDRRGQQVASKERFVRLDKVAPRVVARVRGRRRARQPLKVTVTGLDGRGSGVNYVEVQYGDRTGKVKQFKRFSGTHRYRRRGRYRLQARVVDNAGNVARKTVRLRIAR